MSTEQQVTKPACSELLSSIREDPLSPQMRERVRYAVEVGCLPGEVARGLYTGLEGVLVTYWVALQEGSQRSDDGDFCRVVGIRRHVRTCYEGSDTLLEFASRRSDFCEMLGRMTSWLH